MADTSTLQPVPRKTVSSTSHTAGVETADSAPLSHYQRIVPVWLAWLCVVAVIALAAVWWRWRQRAALRSWKRLAEEIGGQFEARNASSPERILGRWRDRDFALETATSHEDDAPYYHTRGRIPLKNPANFILGLRRKSLLEEVQTRKEAASISLDDATFEKVFFVVSNLPDALPQILTPEARRELLRYSDVEIYVHLGEIEWRRPGEQSELPMLRRLSDTLANMADAIDELPARKMTLSERLADEGLIAKGV